MLCVGLMLPIVVPPFWGKYPDQIAEDERRQRENEAYLAARKQVGTFPGILQRTRQARPSVAAFVVALGRLLAMSLADCRLLPRLFISVLRSLVILDLRYDRIQRHVLMSPLRSLSNLLPLSV